MNAVHAPAAAQGFSAKAVSLIAVVLGFLLSTPIMAAADPESLQTEHFNIVFSPANRRLATELARLCEEIYDEVVADVGVAPRPGIEVIIAQSHETFLARQPHAMKAPEWAAGLAYPERNLMILKAPDAALYGSIDPFRTFRHELAHLVLHQALAGIRIPRWLDEGLAMYEAKEWTLRTTAVISAVTLKKNYIPLGNLKDAFPVDFNAAERAYAQSFSMVSYLFHNFGRQKFHDFIISLKSGLTLSQSAQEGFGLSFYELEKGWHRHLRLRYTWVPVVTSSAALWFLVSMIFLYVYRRKMKRAREKVLEWELEEMWESGGQWIRRPPKFLPDFPDEDDGE
jgi:hypothetical protein